MRLIQIFMVGILDKVPIFIKLLLTLISGFRHDVDEICALQGYYAASCGNSLLMFWDNVLVPSSRLKSPSRKATSNLSLYQRSTYYMGIKIFNSLPPYIKDLSHNIKQFKLDLKNFL
jgi:hypothetical protein